MQSLTNSIISTWENIQQRTENTRGRESAEQRPVKILLADHHEVFRRGMRDLLQERYGSLMIEEAATGNEMLRLVQQRPWTLFLIEASMPGMSGEVLVESVCRAQPSTPVLALSRHPESVYAVRMLKAGAKGYLNKAASATEFLKAVETVRVGRYYVSVEASTSLLAFLANRWEVVPHDQLSTREFQVLTMLASGQVAEGDCERTAH